ncbi:hypothetical protein ACH5RR_027564 [Cinchona calisaya]|uniref:Uncharacterized protein n=1 Tax=Cinchona calisaya TaxID=153742 RepID=A0ABD2Z9P7_9GENT
MGVSGLVQELDNFGITRNKINKMVTKSIRNLKKLEKNSSSTVLNKDSNLIAILSLLQETETITFSILKSLLTFASGTTKESSKSSGWSLVSKIVQPKCVHYVTEQEEEVYNLEKIGDALHALIS